MPVAARRRRGTAATGAAPAAGHADPAAEAEAAAATVGKMAGAALGRRPGMASGPEPVISWGKHAYRLRLACDDATWGAPLVVRTAGTAAAAVESGWLGVLDGAGYPAPATVAHDPTTGTLVFREPAGTPLAERMLAEMLALPRLLAGFGRLHARLHSVALPAGAVASNDQLGDVDALVVLSGGGPVGDALGAELAWLEAHRPPAGPRVISHGELNPVQVYSHGATEVDADPASVPVNWAGAGTADAELDVAATLTGFWSGALYIGNAVQRRMYRMARDPLASGYLSAYRAAAPRPLDEGRLRYWQAFHLCRLAAGVLRCASDGPADAWDPAAAVVQPRAAVTEVRKRIRELAAD
jgi:hypothetical protein